MKRRGEKGGGAGRAQEGEQRRGSRDLKSCLWPRHRGSCHPLPPRPALGIPPVAVGLGCMESGPFPGPRLGMPGSKAPEPQV